MKKTKDTLITKMLNLHKLRKDVTKMKKSAASDYKDQLKEINLEIEDVIDELNDLTGNTEADASEEIVVEDNA